MLLYKLIISFRVIVDSYLQLGKQHVGRGGFDVAKACYSMGGTSLSHLQYSDGPFYASDLSLLFVHGGRKKCVFVLRRICAAVQDNVLHTEAV